MRHYSFIASLIAPRLALLFLFANAVQPAISQRPPDPRLTAAANPGDVSFNDVCAGAPPRESQGNQFEWSPDGKTIAYFKPMPSGFGLRLQLESVSATGAGRTVLLDQKQIDQLFPATPAGSKGFLFPPPRSVVGFAWAAAGDGILLHSDTLIAWLDLSTRQTRNLLTGKEPVSDVQPAPDGRSVAFVRGHNLWVMPVAGGEPRAVTTNGTDTVRQGELDWLYPAELHTRHGYAWSPDSSHIAWLEFDLTGVASYTTPLPADGETPKTIDYPTPGGRNPQVRLFVSAIDGKAPPVAIKFGQNSDSYLPRFQWLPDSRQLALQHLNRAQNKLDLLLADARTGTSKVLVSESDPYWINLADTVYFFKDKPQFLWSSERSGYRHLYLYGLDGKLLRQLTEGNWEVTSLDAVDERSQRFYYTSTEKTDLERHLYAAGLDGKNKVRISSDSGTHEATFAPGVAAYVDNFSTAVKPWLRTVYSAGSPAGDITAPNANTASPKLFTLDEAPADSAARLNLRPVDFLTVKTHDGVDMNAFQVRPPAFSPQKQYPAIVYVHGGPGQQAVRDVWQGDISLYIQLLAQHGYIVFAADNRGTAGKGHAFEEYIHLRFEGQEMTDQRDAVRFLQALPYIDPARTGIFGRGFGGALVVNAMRHPPLLFKAGFAMAPVVNWLRYDSAFTERYLGDRVNNQDGYLASSQLGEWGRYKGQLFAAQGMADLEVHPDQALQMQYDAADDRRYVELSLYPAQPHILEDPNACATQYQRATDIFARALEAPPPPKD